MSTRADYVNVITQTKINQSIDTITLMEFNNGPEVMPYEVITINNGWRI